MATDLKTATRVLDRSHFTIFRGPRGLTGSERPILKYLVEAKRRVQAEERINQKAAALGHNSTQATGSLIASGDGYYRDYVFGRIYYRPGHDAFHVYGNIGMKYAELGGPASWLGWPTSDEVAFAQGGRATTFENGAIYYWPDTGAIELANVTVRYKGLICFGETDWDQGSSSDEPYLIFGVVPVETEKPSAPRTRIYEDVDGGDTRHDDIELFRGLPYGLSLTVVLMEHDFGDPDQYRSRVEEGVEAAGHGLARAAATIPYVGPLLAAGVEWALSEFGDDIAGALNDGLDTGDDQLGVVSMVITAKDMVTMTRAQLRHEKAIAFHIETPIISGEGASYKAYFDIHAV
jgi:hypothetical protein